MDPNHLTGTLAVILHADVAGSTRLVQQDEQLAHERIQKAFNRFSNFIEKYQGKVLELRGDALLAEFGRASDAVSSALAFQVDHTYQISRIKDDLKPVVRIGVAMGEVVIADDTVTGAGVVLAQRVEQLADAGGLCITAALHEALPNRMPFDLENLGDQELKGFDESVRVYRVELSPDASVPEPQSKPPPVKPQQTSKPGMVFGVVVFLLVLIAAYFYQEQSPNEEPTIEETAATESATEEPSSVAAPAFPLPDKPSIAVLPFTNMSSDAEQEFFADGMTEDLITDISKVEGLFVIARNSVFTYKGRAVKVQQVARELGVRYVMEGSVRRVGNQVRVNAQLIDATTGGHLWADRYDGTLDDVFSMQDKITASIVTALELALNTETSGNEAAKTSSTEAYDAYLRGWEHYHKGTPDDFSKSITYLEKSLELDPSYADARTALAVVYWNAAWRRWVRSSDISYSHVIDRARRYLKNAMATPSALTHQIASEMAVYSDRKAEKALVEAELAIGLDRNDPAGHMAMANALIKDGRAQEAVLAMQRAIRLDPRFPAFYLTRLGRAQFDLGEYQLAAETLERGVRANPQDDRAYMYLVATYGYLGHREKANEAIISADSLKIKAGLERLTQEEISSLYWVGDRIRLREGLKKADVRSGYEWVSLVTRNVDKFEVEGAIKIGVEKAKQLHERGVPFLDTHLLYVQGRIPGATYLNWYRTALGRLREVNETRLLELVEKSQPIVVYSSSFNITAANSAAYAVSNGFEKVYYFEGGLDEWKKAGYPVEASKP